MTTPVKPRPLTPAMQHVLDRMREGWALGESTSMTTDKVWLQQNGIGRGGATETVTRATLRGLVARKLVVRHYHFPTATYTLAKEAL